MTIRLRSATLDGYLALAASFRLDVDSLLAAARLDRRQIADPESRVPAIAVARLLESSAQAAGVADFGLRLAATRQLSNLGPLGLVVQQEPTLGQALDAMVRYLRLHNESLTMRIERQGDWVTLVFSLVVDRPVPLRQSIELAIGAFYRIVRSMLGDAWRPRQVGFGHPAPPSLAVCRQVFGDVEVVYDAAFDGVVCRARDLERPLPTANPVLARYAREYLDTLALRMAADGLSNQVRHLVRTLLPSGRCTVERVADCLGVDRRTVHRHLARDGTTFSALTVDARRELVALHVEHGSRPLTDVADLMGFSSPAAFAAWFRAQYGCTASQWRGRARGAAGRPAG